MNQSPAATPANEEIRKVLEGDFHNEALKRVQGDPEMFVIVTDIEQNLRLLHEIITTSKLAPKTIERLQTVAGDGIALLAACVSFGSVAGTPGSIMAEVDRWNAWVDATATDVAIASTGNE